MGEALIRGFIQSGVSSAGNLSASVRSEERQRAMQQLGIQARARRGLAAAAGQAGGLLSQAAPSPGMAQGIDHTALTVGAAQVFGNALMGGAADLCDASDIIFLGVRARAAPCPRPTLRARSWQRPGIPVAPACRRGAAAGRAHRGPHESSRSARCRGPRR